eukprot:3983458-Alexandrium_andersonii.AAC.1
MSNEPCEQHVLRANGAVLGLEVADVGPEEALDGLVVALDTAVRRVRADGSAAYLSARPVVLGNALDECQCSILRISLQDEPLVLQALQPLPEEDLHVE